MPVKKKLTTEERLELLRLAVVAWGELWEEVFPLLPTEEIEAIGQKWAKADELATKAMKGGTAK